MDDYQALKNVSRKLQGYLREHNLSILKLAKKIPDIKYQTLKRIVEFNNNESLPNVSSLIHLSSFLNCTLSELLSDYIKLNINYYPSINDFYTNKNSKIVQIQLPIDNYFSRNPNSIFALEANSFRITNSIISSNAIQGIHIFSKMEEVEYDGYYITKVQDYIDITNVISVSSTQLTIQENKKISSVNRDSVSIIAKFIKAGILTKNNQEILIAT